MPRFYLNIRNGNGFTPDEEGRDFAGAEEARAEAVKGARSLLSAEVEQGQLDLRGAIEVTDEQGAHVMSIAFRDALVILDGPVPAADEGARP
jgi:hypothetical protein